MSFLNKLSDILERSKDCDKSFAVCFIDIDDFKSVNDNLGQNVGDKLLSILVSRLNPILDDDCHLGRLGGDEFGLIIEDAKNLDRLHVLLHRCINAASEPLHIDQSIIHTSISIGIAVFPFAGQNISDLISNADIAMYRAKSNGKSTYEFFSEEMNTVIKHRHAVSMALREPISNKELSIVYQPQIDLKSGKPIGIEALLRWEHKELGRVGPDEFIPIAEETGFIREIGQWVLRNGLRDFEVIQDHYKLPLCISLNVSTKELESPEYNKLLKNVLVDTNVDPCSISLEITESAIMKNIHHAKSRMKNIEKLGISFALDDFGTGYSSMQYLKTLPLSTLKIDKVFIRDILDDQDDATIVKATIQLAHGLGLQVLAEGVETERQLDFLREHGCDQVQGFLFCKPMNLDDLLVWLHSQQSDPN